MDTKKVWLLKADPGDWEKILEANEKGRSGRWDGIRNHQAKRNLELMKKNDKVLIYKTGKGGKIIMATAKVYKTAYPDPKDENWVCINLKVISKKWKTPVSWETMKNEMPGFQAIRQPRLSVVPVSEKEYQKIRELRKR